MTCEFLGRVNRCRVDRTCFRSLRHIRIKRCFALFSLFGYWMKYVDFQANITTSKQGFLWTYKKKKSRWHSTKTEVFLNTKIVISVCKVCRELISPFHHRIQFCPFKEGAFSKMEVWEKWNFSRQWHKRWRETQDCDLYSWKPSATQCRALTKP